MRTHPRVITGIEINGCHALVGRLHEWQSLRPRHRHRPGIGEIPDGRRRRVLHQLDGAQSCLRWHKQPPRLRINRGTWPIDTASRARRLNDRPAFSTHRRRSKNRYELSPPRDPDRFFPQRRCEVDEIVDGNTLEIERRRFGRKWLRRRVPFARHVSCRHRPLLYRPHRLTGDPIKDVGKCLLTRLRNCLDLTPIDSNVNQVAGGREIVIPETMVDRLEMPHSLSRLHVHGNETLRKQVVPRPHTSVPVVGRGPRRQVYITKLLVHRHRAPHIRVATVAPGLVLPRVRPEFVPLRDRVENPLHLTGARVECPHVPRIGFSPGQRRVLHDASDNHGIAHDRQRLRVRQPCPIYRTPKTGTEINRTICAKVRVQRTSPRIHRHEQQVVCGDENACIATLGILPVGHATMLPAHVRRSFHPIVGSRIVRPHKFTTPGIQRRHLAEGGTGVDQASHHQRRRLERPGPNCVILRSHLTRKGGPSPGDL